MQNVLEVITKSEPLPEKFREFFLYLRRYGHMLRWDEENTKWLMCYVVADEMELRVYDSPAV